MIVFVSWFDQEEGGERVVSEEEMEAAVLTWSKGLNTCPPATKKQHPM